MADSRALGDIAGNKCGGPQSRTGLLGGLVQTCSLLGEVLLLPGGFLIPTFATRVTSERSFGPVHIGGIVGAGFML